MTLNIDNVTIDEDGLLKSQGGSEFTDVTTDATGLRISPSTGSVVIQNDASGKGTLSVEGNGANDAELALQYGATPTANTTITQMATSLEINPGAATASITVNPDGNDTDLIVEGDTDPDLFHLDASTDRIGIGIAAPTQKLDLRGNQYIQEGAGAGLSASSIASCLVISSDQLNAGMSVLAPAGGNSNVFFGELGNPNPNKAAHVQFVGSVNELRFGVDNVSVIRLQASGAHKQVLLDTTNTLAIGGTIPTSAQLGMISTTQGFLPPRMTTVQRDAIASPAIGLVIYNDDDNCLQIYNGSIWGCFLTGGTFSSPHNWQFSTPSGSSGTFYFAGFYKFGASSNDFSPSINFGSVNNAYAAHLLVVTGAATVDEVTITVTGTSFDESTGVRTGADTQTIVIPNATPANTYFETSKKWIGQVSIETTAGTAVICNYGYSKYYDNRNTDFTIEGLEATWIAGANDVSPDIAILHHKQTGWVYGAGGVPDYSANVLWNMASDYSPEKQLVNNEQGAWKRPDISQAILGSGVEGIIIQVDTTANKAFEGANIALTLSE